MPYFSHDRIPLIAVFALFLTITQAFVPATGQAPDNSRTDAGKEGSRVDNSQKPPEPNALVSKDKQRNGSDRSLPDESRSADQQLAMNTSKTTAMPDPWTWHDKWLWGANLILAVVGLGGIFVATLTLFKIERQTRAGEVAAKAALLSAQAVINAERPWLLVIIESVKGPMGGFNIFVENRGRTPAMITAAHMGCVRVGNISHLPEDPPYKPASMVQDLIVIPDERPMITWFDDRILKNMLGDVRLYSWEGQTFVFGKITYRDLADPSPNRIHETRWIGLHEGSTEEESDSIFQIEGIGASEKYAKYS